MKEKYFNIYNLFKNYNDIPSFVLFKVLIFCGQVPFAELADLEVPSAYPKRYPGKFPIYIFKTWLYNPN